MFVASVYSVYLQYIIEYLLRSCFIILYSASVLKSRD